MGVGEISIQTIPLITEIAFTSDELLCRLVRYR